MALLRQISPDTLAAPRRGRPPPAPPGYEQDPSDPYMYYLVIPNCENRKITFIKRPCGCEKTTIWCTILNIPVTRWGCKNKCPKLQ